MASDLISKLRWNEECKKFQFRSSDFENENFWVDVKLELVENDVGSFDDKLSSYYINLLKVHECKNVIHGYYAMGDEKKLIVEYYYENLREKLSRKGKNYFWVEVNNKWKMTSTLKAIINGVCCGVERLMLEKIKAMQLSLDTIVFIDSASDIPKLKNIWDVAISRSIPNKMWTQVAKLVKETYHHFNIQDAELHPEVQELQTLLKNVTLSSYGIVYFHPALVASNERLNFILRIQKEQVDGLPLILDESKFHKEVSRDWISVISTETRLSPLLTFVPPGKGKGKNTKAVTIYYNTPSDLLKFIRNAFFHVNSDEYLQLGYALFDMSLLEPTIDRLFPMLNSFLHNAYFQSLKNVVRS